MSKKILPVYFPSSVIWPKSWCLIAIISCHLPSLYCLPSSLVVVTSTADPWREWMREKNQWVNIHVTYTHIYICIFVKNQLANFNMIQMQACTHFKQNSKLKLIHPSGFSLMCFCVTSVLKSEKSFSLE